MIVPSSSPVHNPLIQEETITDVLKNRVVFFTGYPGSGKGTQGKLLANELKIHHLSTGELFRAEAAKGTEIGLKMDAFMKEGKVIPKELVFDYLKAELSDSKYQNGFFLDGYPKNQESYEFIIKTLAELNLEPLAAIHFDISREICLERLTGRLHCNQCEHDFHLTELPPKEKDVCDHCTGPLESRPDDTREAIVKRLDVFDNATTPLLNQFRDAELLFKIDAKQKPQQVNNVIVSKIFELGRRHAYESSSYHLRAPQGPENSSVFHNHIDAKSQRIVRAIVKDVEALVPDCQNKIYLVSHLHLGPQVTDPEFASTYQGLPNFHTIRDATDEAFSTGKMGEEGFNYDQIKATLETAFQYPNHGVMTELEEDIYEMHFDKAGTQSQPVDRGNTPYAIDWSKLPGWKEKQIQHVPQFELHHGFEIEKMNSEENPPIDIAELSQRTTSDGFKTGGWFIFRKEKEWAYRSNQFSNEEHLAALATLRTQALQLRAIVASILPDCSFTSSCSMEKVHAIWKVES